MKKREFKSSSKRVLDLMINSIYTNKEIFLRELLSNASDAIDKLYYESLTNKDLNVDKKDLVIRIMVDRDNRILSIMDTGCGMTEEELENNLGTIAESGSLKFKEENDGKDDVDIIGQFGVGFYSAFMVAKKVEVITKSLRSDDAYLWSSEGTEGYTISKTNKSDNGTIINLYLKDDLEDEVYSEFLEEYKIRNLVTKYSDYIRYPILMEVENSKLKEGSDSEYETYREEVTLNSMIPLWKKNKNDITDEEYNNFYNNKFMDYEKPLKVIHTSVEGLASYKAMMFIPSHAPYDFYNKEYKKGLQLYTNGVLIMDKCEELLPDYYSFVKGVVDSDDLILNISRETLQNDRHVKQIAKSLETKIHNELLGMLKEDKESYKKFFKEFGNNIKFGVYNFYGADKEKLRDLLVFYSASKKDYITLDDYVKNMKKKQEHIYYACGDSIEKISLIPQVEQVLNKKYDVLYLTDYVDEFAIQMLQTHGEKEFKNVCSEDLNLDTKEEKKIIEEANNENKEILNAIKEALNNEVEDVKLTNKLVNHPVCLTTEGNVSVEMQKVLNAMPTDEKISAKLVLEINANHPIIEKLKKVYKKDKDLFSNYAKVLYSEARLIEGLSIDNPTEISNIICDIISK